MGLGSILMLLLAGIISPLVIRSRKKSDLIEAVHNARQIGLALEEFETSYGSLPNAATAKEVKATTLSPLDLSGSSANACFRQLIASEILQAESMFYARGPASRKPDNVFTGTRALEKGEVAFTYVAGIPAVRPPDTPLVMTPLIHGKHTFDARTSSRFFFDKAVILRADQSVKTMRVDKSGAVLHAGKNLLDPSQPFWGGTKPDLRWPE